HRGIDIARSDARRPPQALGRGRHPAPAVEDEPVVRVMVRRSGALDPGEHVGGTLPQIPRALRGREHDGATAIAFEAAVEQAARRPGGWWPACVVGSRSTGWGLRAAWLRAAHATSPR